jgi:hypothetical protein
LSKPSCDCRADALAGAGHDCSFVFQSHFMTSVAWQEGKEC